MARLTRIRIAGIDCAVKPADVGVVLAEFDGRTCRLLDAVPCSNRKPPHAVVREWHAEHPLQLLALDAPLGWPAAMKRILPDHEAGATLGEIEANALFRRETDRDVRRRLGKQSLDVGADRIARTAWASLKFLETLRTELDEPIPVARTSGAPDMLSAIEVYPAATLIAHGHNGSHLKDSDERRQLADVLCDHHAIETESVREALVGSRHVLDASICILAALDFLTGHAVAPSDDDLAREEGWIWVRDRVDDSTRGT